MDQKHKMMGLAQILIESNELRDFRQLTNKSAIDVGSEDDNWWDGEMYKDLLGHSMGFNVIHLLDKKFKGSTEDHLYRKIKHSIGGKKENFVFHNTDLHDIELVPDGPFDLIILSNILHLFELDEAKTIYEHFVSLTSDYGVIFIKVASENRALSNEIGPKWGLTAAQLRDFIGMDPIHEDEDKISRQILARKKT